MAEGGRELVAEAVTARFGDAAAAGGDDDAGRGDRAVLGAHEEGSFVAFSAGDTPSPSLRTGQLDLPGGFDSAFDRLCGLDSLDTPAAADLGAGDARGVEQGLENGARLIRDWKELSRRFALEHHAEGLEKRDRRFDVERAEHLGDGVAVAVEVCGADLVVSDVAAAAAGDQDLRPDLLRAIEGHGARAGAGREDRRHQPGRAGADDHDVVGAVVVRTWIWPRQSLFRAGLAGLSQF